MPSNNTTIKPMREVLRRVHTELYIEGKLNRPLFCQTLDVLNQIGEQKIVELAPDVLNLIDVQNASIRQEAIATLSYSTRLYLSQFKDKAYEIWHNDIDETVRGTALGGWAGYYINTKNAAIIKELYTILKNNNETSYVRLAALSGIFLVANEPSDSYDAWMIGSKFIDSETPEEFNRLVDWEDVHKVIRKYVPEIMQH